MMIFASCSCKSQSGVASNTLCLIHPRQEPLDLLLVLTTYLSCTMLTTKPTETFRDVKPRTGSKLETTEPEKNGIISHWHAYLVRFIVSNFPSTNSRLITPCTRTRRPGRSTKERLAWSMPNHPIPQTPTLKLWLDSSFCDEFQKKWQTT